MNEALSRREIEDVLSSIRRLVSHAPDRPTAQAQVGAELGPAGKPETLVLTSALRVADAPEATSRPSLPETGVTYPPEAAFSTEPEQRLTPQTDAPPGPADDHNAIAMGPPESGADAVAASAAATRTALQRLHDATGISPTSPPPSATTMMQDTASTDQGPGIATEQDPLASATAATDAALEATLARLEQALSAPMADKAAQPPREADTTARLHFDAPGSNDAPSEGSDSDAPIIDEAMLYQIVANIVRQELQGELGEKITRNIRKLVRAEVARELHLRKL